MAIYFFINTKYSPLKMNKLLNKRNKQNIKILVNHYRYIYIKLNYVNT